MILANYKYHYYLRSISNRPLIIFLHGFMGNCHEFEEAIQLLESEFNCLVIDLPGHGQTQILGGDECYKMANTALSLINLLDYLRIPKGLLVSYSMGGRLALYLALHFPHRFTKVVLESASPGLPTELERLERVQKDEQIARKLDRIVEKSDWISFLSNWYSQPIFGNIKNHVQFQKLIEIRLQNNPKELAKSLRMMGIGFQPSLWEKLQDNTIPLLLLAGEYDEKFVDINTQMANICKLSQLKVIRDAGHNIHFENTMAFVENIRQFLL
ncbi:2-succinyl-6-hydroxy-2,4-cyclohexadiene-1-carboxylate synthase [Chlorogloeopsis sp. ULAP01]|uniref:2-succinyl-6-hydroxy-2, 4-cyclohexadiene-1-carboxylate synthase n=1 Tax=Chlorogloeopsis sp. ULAP01 TaxID=3056483 RepID=UPI0025AABB82|nr:2-succinyl-6-hydroxy-2,4-cyclohexadiene-1-carboxylate synthase [Chlorogloeopsis sp. ULAP01]MDM9385607.1 2-succinyl-6-hydroxy-2,4-cyclohexadiene-1-carboxylate synthase [Chlorogloeopsis sp. ULAP01]